MNLQKVIASVFCAFVAGGATRSGVHFERIYPLNPEEGVFAYARISPDGRVLVYASEVTDSSRKGNAPTRTITVVNLATHTILFTEPGIDAYWSPDGSRMIYAAVAGRRSSVSVRHQGSGVITRDVAPLGLGDYFSWGVRDGKQLILTIASRYYYLAGDSAVLPAASVAPCERIGVGDRPLLSKDGMRITTFVRGTIVVRDLTDCEHIVDTGVHGAKADFSWDGRYIAFHAPKARGNGYEIDVVDLEQKTIRTVTNLPGSSLFPSWTRDGRLCFRYDGDDYRGFMMATDVLDASAGPLPTIPDHVPLKRTWGELFPETPLPAHHLNVVMVWATWSAHSPAALMALQGMQDDEVTRPLDLGVMMATDPGSEQKDVERMLNQFHIKLPRIPLGAGRLSLTEADNQIPTTLLFRDGQLLDRRLGAQTFAQLIAWITASSHAP